MSSFRFDDYKIEYISFNLNKEFKNENENESEVDFGLQVGVNISDDNKQAEVSLKLDIYNKDSKEAPFKLTASITGWFSTDDDIDVDKYIQFCKVNATAILFPYLRSAVTDITKISNVQPLVLPLVNVYNLIKNDKLIKPKNS